ncbi:MAG TPA: hypothetical protein VEI94_07750 [Candidatus Bathyarchaeia archaeon]|nr:hypothetical protein [Candidatus Bathyarchaeia archaeon]
MPVPAELPDAKACARLDTGRDSVGILTSPEHPVAGEPLRVLVATFAGIEAPDVRIAEVARSPLSATITTRPGIPAATVVSLDAPPDARALEVVVTQSGRVERCMVMSLHPRGASSRAMGDARGAGAGAWPMSRSWSGAEEALYAAWLRELFRAPRGEELAFPRLDAVTSDPERNLLHDSLGLGEDRAPPDGLRLEPDCADTPYFLRAYFAWKRSLPFAFRSCSRGERGHAPTCGGLHAASDAGAGASSGGSELARAQHSFTTLARGVQSGNGRAALDDDASDFYPIELSRRALRPGVIYADPYGHILVLVDWSEGEAGHPGVLYAIDGQPDGSITRKRFWEGNFLWNPDPALGGSGFKAFRPVVRIGSGPELRAPTNAEIAASGAYGDFSLEQAGLDGATFYDRMEALITPGTRDPLAAQQEAIVALSEAVEVRKTSVENGEKFTATHPGAVIPMPEGFAIFEASGAWEDYSTPARDLRLLIALDLVQHFEDKVLRNPRAYGIDSPTEADGVRRTLLDDRTRELADPKLGVTYARSDGTPASLTLADLAERSAALEVAYNPNDCLEVRWGAPPGSAEASSCRRRAPEEQRRRMEVYRTWFHERRRPARGDAAP